MKKYLFSHIAIIGFLLLPFAQIFAADFLMASDKTQVTVGDTVTTTVFVDSGGVAVNSAEGVISFPPDTLSVESVSLSSSVFSIWVEQPSFSNTKGTVSFNGGSPNPGFTGSRGAVLRIVFKAKKTGSANIAFVSGGIYANDGLGTEVTNQKQGLSVAVTEKVSSNQSSISVPTPNVQSVDMPDQEKWYSKKQAVFTWENPPQIVSTQLALDSSPNGTPKVTYTPPIGNKELTGLVDGVLYLHVRFITSAGSSDIAHRKIKVDTVPPTNLTVTSQPTVDDQIELAMSSTDKTSGVQSYKVFFGGNLLAETVADARSGSETKLILPAIPAGFRELSVRAYDRAGNNTEKIISVESPTIKAPTISKYPEKITKGDTMEIIGTTYAEGEVRLFVQDEKDQLISGTAKANKDGEFTWKSQSVSKTGVASVWAKAVRGSVESDASAKVSVTVEESGVVRAGLSVLQALAIIVPLVVIILAFVFALYYFYYRFRIMRKRLITDLNTTEGEVHKIFSIITADAKQLMALFKEMSARRKMSDDEKEVMTTLEKDIAEAELYFKKRLNKIEKEDTSII